jgi:hypothetical protein
MNPTPYDFNEARDAINQAKATQKAGEAQVKAAYREFAMARQAYQVALAEAILRYRAEHAATICAELARGDKKVAELRFKRDVAEGVMEAAKSAIWRHTADRKDLARLVDWSARVAPDGQYDREPVSA